MKATQLKSSQYTTLRPTILSLSHFGLELRSPGKSQQRRPSIRPYSARILAGAYGVITLLDTSGRIQNFLSSVLASDQAGRLWGLPEGMGDLPPKNLS